MTTFQLLLFIIAGVIFYLFFKQLFAGNHPKRGIDFEAKLSDDQIGGLNRPDKIFSQATKVLTRVEQLEEMADAAIKEKDFEEAKKALSSLLILEEDNVDILHKMAHLLLQTKEYSEAKIYYTKLLSLNDEDDMAHVLLANTLHKLKEDEEALIHHNRAIELDEAYAPHYFNYANTLYEMKRKDEALASYTKAYDLDNALSEAKEMISRLKDNHES